MQNAARKQPYERLRDDEPKSKSKNKSDDSEKEKLLGKSGQKLKWVFNTLAIILG